VEWGLLLLFGALGLQTQRFLGFFALVAAPYVTRDLSLLCAGTRALAPWPRAAAVSAAALAMVALELSHTTLALGPGIDTRFLPVAACDYIERSGVRGRGFNEFWQGGYLLWRFWPQRDRLPFIDIHQSASPADRALVARLGRDPLAFGALDRERHFEWALTTADTRLSGGLADELDADSTWRLVFSDDAAVLYARRAGPLAAPRITTATAGCAAAAAGTARRGRRPIRWRGRRCAPSCCERSRRARRGRGSPTGCSRTWTSSSSAGPTRSPSWTRRSRAVRNCRAWASAARRSRRCWVLAS
jgi:hypothetical protein